MLDGEETNVLNTKWRQVKKFRNLLMLYNGLEQQTGALEYAGIESNTMASILSISEKTIIQ